MTLTDRPDDSDRPDDAAAETLQQDLAPEPAPTDAPSDDEPRDPAPAGDTDTRRGPSPRMISADVLVREVTPLRARNRELEASLHEHRRKLQEAHELLQRLQPGDQGPEHRAPDPGRHPADVHRQVESSDDAVERRAAELTFQREARRISEQGIQTYGNAAWLGACQLMDGLGLNSTDFVRSVMEIAGTDRTHEVFAAIAEDPERAARLASLSPTRRIAEISRIAEHMTAQMAAPRNTGSSTTRGNGGPADAARPARVSRAPDPAPRTDTGSRASRDWRGDNVSDEEFSRSWDEHYRSRGHAARR